MLKLRQRCCKHIDALFYLKLYFTTGKNSYIPFEYEGEWKYGKEWNGTEYDKNGNIIGKWVNGVLQK